LLSEKTGDDLDRTGSPDVGSGLHDTVACARVLLVTLLLGTGTGKPLALAGGGTASKRGSCFLDAIYVLGGSGGLDNGE